jgi:hypothetical protein
LPSTARVPYTRSSSFVCYFVFRRFRRSATRKIMSKAKAIKAKTTTPKAKTTMRAQTAKAIVKRRVPKAKMAAAAADDGASETKARRKTATPKAAPAKPAAGGKAPLAKSRRPLAATPPAVEAKPKAKAKDLPKSVARASAPAPAPVKPRPRRPKANVAAAEAPTVDDQQRVEAYKYGVAARSPRQFEEERFLFPRNYEVNRIRLVVRDPQWLFAYWDVNPRVFDAIRAELGERVMALSRLTLKIADPESSASDVILLPYGARSWYVRVEGARRGAVAELGITLPSGQFRSLACSNAVHLPRSGPSTQAAARSMSYAQAWLEPGLLATGVFGEEEAGLPSLEEGGDPGTSIRSGRGASDRFAAEMQPGSVSGAASVGLGASDVFRR